MFVAGGNDGIFTSNDGSTWELRKSGQVSTIIYVYYRFMALQGTNILNSSDGITWRDEVSGATTSYDIAYGNHLYVAVGNNPTTILTSPDSYTWTKQTIDFSSPLNKVLYAENENNMFVIMGVGKIFAFTINTVIGLNNISDLTAVNNKIDNLTTLKLKHLATVSSKAENLSTCIEGLKGLNKAENLTYTRTNIGTQKNPQKFNLGEILNWMDKTLEQLCYPIGSAVRQPDEVP
jgi:hypothetical protein